MKCDLYEEFSNGAKMSLVGLALGAILWLVTGSGKKKPEHDQRRRGAHYADTAAREAAGRSISDSMFKGWR
jgi:hypothetical protein